MATVLIVDDSKIMRNMIQGTVEVLGLDHLQAGNGQEGLEILRARGKDIVLVCLDMNMPEMGGIELLRRMKSDPDLCEIPVMMVTSEIGRASVVEAVKAGAANYVAKPFTQEELATKMADSLGLGV